MTPYMALFVLVALGVGLWLLPALVVRTQGPHLVIRGHRVTVVDAPLQLSSAWIRNTANLPTYESKADRCTSTVVNGITQYTVQGRFLGLRWSGTFDMHPTADGGFHSTMVHGIHKGAVEGGFRLRSVPQGTEISHYETYRMNVWIPFVVAARPLIQAYLNRSMTTEMAVIGRELQGTRDVG